MSAITSSKTNKSGGIENSLLSILFIGGILGVFHFLQSPERQHSDLINSIRSQSQTTENASISINEGLAFLQIDGAMEQNVPIHFTIVSFNEKVQYFLDFGDGVRRQLKQANTRYTYRESGAFRVKLIAVYQREEKILHAETLYISRTSELADGF
jgi:hypothetical protein